MTGAEIERTIDFLLRGQANHEVRLGALTEKVSQLTDQVAETNRLMQLHAETQTQFIRIITRHIEAQGEINASLRASINQADVRINRTDTRLDRLEGLVERYIEGRNGQS